jgi:flagellar hook-associated protein 1 FlgK
VARDASRIALARFDTSAVVGGIALSRGDGRGALALADSGQRKEATEALLKEAKDRRASFEGVNLDEELINLTTYQQAFNASARLIQATKDMFDVLTGILG